MKKYIFILAIAAFFYSCDNSPTETPKAKEAPKVVEKLPVADTIDNVVKPPAPAKEVKPVPEGQKPVARIPKKSRYNAKKRKQIFRKKYKQSIVASFQLDSSLLLFLTEEYDSNRVDRLFKLVLLENIHDEWQEKQKAQISNCIQCKFESVELISFDSKNYFYFEEYHAGGSLGNFDIDFSLYDIESERKYAINYYFTPSSSHFETKFRNNKNISSSSNASKIKQFLNDKISASNRIEKPNEIQALVRQYLAYNEDPMSQLMGAQSFETPVPFKRIATRQALFNLQNHKTNYPGYDNVAKVENENFIIISAFKKMVLGYRKDTEEYFLVWVPKSLYDWVHKMKFDSDGNLILYDRKHDKPWYKVNLYESTVLRL